MAWERAAAERANIVVVWVVDVEGDDEVGRWETRFIQSERFGPCPA